jgi:hypothetical protein
LEKGAKMDKTIISRLLLALLVLSRSSAVLNGVVKQAAAVFDPWNIPVVYVQPILLGPSTLRVNVAVYNLTNAFWPTDEEWMPGGPLGAYSAGPVARYNYSLGNLYAFDISIRWNASVLSYVSHGRTVPRGTTPQSFR